MLIKDMQINHRLSQIIPNADADTIRAIRSIPAIADAISDFHARDIREDGHEAFQRLTRMAECVAAGMELIENQ